MGKCLDRAKELRAITEPHYNCAQSVLIPFARQFGLDEEIAYRIGVNYGGGLKTGSVCGVITGALMVLGLAGLDQPSDAQAFIARFSEAHEGMTMCSDLLRVNEERGGVKKPHCDRLVFETVEILEGLLADRI